MNAKKIICAAGLGAVIGYTVKAQLEKMPIKPEHALKKAKTSFKQSGPVSGSWIYMKPEEMTYNELEYTVYRGGITRTMANVNTQYEFLVDASTGSIISVEQTNAL